MITARPGWWPRAVRAAARAAISARSCLESWTPSISWAGMAGLVLDKNEIISACGIARRFRTFIVIFIDVLASGRRGLACPPPVQVVEFPIAVVDPIRITCGLHDHVPYYEIEYRILKNTCST